MYDHGVDLAQARRRLAQRPGGQQQAVAETARAVDHGDLDIAREAVVLQAVVADDDVAFGMRGEQRARGCNAVAADPDRAAAAAREQHRLVAARARIAIGVYRARRLHSCRRSRG